jgi:hypothetical protein
MVTLNFGKDGLLRLCDFGNSFRLSICANGRVGWWLVSRNVCEESMLSVSCLRTPS